MKVKFELCEVYRDFEKVLSMELMYFGQEAGGYTEIEDFSHNHKSVYLVYVDDQLAGYCSIQMDKEAKLDRAAVLEGFRGLGLQRKMINFRVKEAKRYGWQEITTYTSVDSIQSMNNLIRCGFKAYWPDNGNPSGNFVYLKKEQGGT